MQAQFYRIKARRGPKKAIMAVAASILTAVYHMLKDGTMLSRTLAPITSIAAPPTSKTSIRLARRLANLGYAVQINALRRTSHRDCLFSCQRKCGFRLGANDGARGFAAIDHAAAGEHQQLRGAKPTRGSERSAEKGARAFTSMAHTSRACEAEPTRSASRPTRSSRLGGASPISFSFYSDSGRTLELGRSDGTLARSARAQRGTGSSPTARIERVECLLQACLTDIGLGAVVGAKIVGN